MPASPSSSSPAAASRTTTTSHAPTSSASPWSSPANGTSLHLVLVARATSSAEPLHCGARHPPTARRNLNRSSGTLALVSAAMVVLMAGGPVADSVFADLAPRISALRSGGHMPGLATVLIGDDEPSARYVAMKMRKAEELGCHSPHVHLPGATHHRRRHRRGTAPQRRPCGRRHARPAPRARPHRLRRGAHGGRSRQGRRRHAPHQRRTARARGSPGRCRARPPASRPSWRTTRCPWPAARW